LRKKYASFNNEAEQIVAEDQTDRSNVDEECEEAAIKKRYLGIVKNKRKVRRLNDRNFAVDWNAGENIQLLIIINL
ncbi:unnamed protein product, partial [Rotaria sordida]